VRVIESRHGGPTLLTVPQPERIVRLEDERVVLLDQRTRFARNPAFDVTPAELIAAIVTEQGVHRAPVAESPGGVVAV
jgi:methylthioribose-1-phosphate isomerase